MEADHKRSFQDEFRIASIARPLKRVRDKSGTENRMSMSAHRHRKFEERLVSMKELEAKDLPECLAVLTDQALPWSLNRRFHAASLVFTFVSKGTHDCLQTFVSLKGTTLLADVLAEATIALRAGAGQVEAAHQSSLDDVRLHTLACTRCLLALKAVHLPLDPRIVTSLNHLRGIRSHGLEEVVAIADELNQARPCKDTNAAPIVVAASSKEPVESSARDKVVELIMQGFPDIPDARDIAKKVEDALFSAHGGAPSKYRQQARMLKSNLVLSGNAELRRRICSGEVPVEELVAMDSNALAPEALQEQRRIEQQRVLKESTNGVQWINAFMRSPLEQGEFSEDTSLPIRLSVLQAGGA
jgi:hypothetical protein